MELEVGMYYTRTNDGKLGLCKCGNLTPEEYVDTYKDTYNIKKASHNIIDLIEVGDYVNESRVVYFMIDEEKSIKQGIDEKIGVVVEEKWETTKYLTKDIKSIVTKEVFESMSYKVGD